MQKVRHVHANGDEGRHLLPDEGLQAFMSHCMRRVGEAYFRMPRNTITAFVNLLAVLEQNPSADWRELLGHVAVQEDRVDAISDAEAPGGGDGELAGFRL